jgi:hypothetical protein
VCFFQTRAKNRRKNSFTFAANLREKMKKLAVIVWICLVFVSRLGAQVAKNPSIDLEGTILSENRTLQGALVNVTRDGKPFTSFLTDIDGSYNLYLPMGSEYVVTVSKKDYVKKMYTVSTTGVSSESAQKKFPVIVADVELFLFYDGVDYSIFNQPMNKYYYNPKKDNFEYDKAYLKYMLAKVEEVRKAEKQAMMLASSKGETDKKNAELAQQAALKEAMQKERDAMEAEMIAKLQAEAEAKKAEMDKALANQAAQLNEFMKDKAIPDATKVKTNKDPRIAALLAKYKNGVTEEIIQGKDVVIIQRIVVRDDMAWVYQKKIFSWGGVACFRDGISISESAFEHETKKYS